MEGTKLGTREGLNRVRSAKLRQGQSLELQWDLGIKDGWLEDEFESEN